MQKVQPTGYVQAGVIAGLAGGIVFGIMMQAMGMIGMVGGLVGNTSAWAGWLVHLAISVFIGLIYGVIVRDKIRLLIGGIGSGIGYAMAWWVLGPLVLMPLMMSMPLLNVTPGSLRSLMGHVAFGSVLGVVHFILAKRTAE